MAIDESKMKKDTLQDRSDQLISTAELMNAIQGKIFELFTSGGEAAISSEDNFFCWLTPGVPVSASEFEFAKEGLSGVVRANTTTNNGPAAGGNRKATVAEQLIKKRPPIRSSRLKPMKRSSQMRKKRGAKLKWTRKSLKSMISKRTDQ